MSEITAIRMVIASQPDNDTARLRRAGCYYGRRDRLYHRWYECRRRCWQDGSWGGRRGRCGCLGCLRLRGVGRQARPQDQDEGDENEDRGGAECQDENRPVAKSVEHCTGTLLRVGTRNNPHQL